MNVGSTTTYDRAPGETTEWEDILRDKGILPPKEEDKAKALNDLLDEAKERAEAEKDHLADKSVGELDELEDEYADSRVLDDYRKRRVEQLKQMALKNKFGRVYPLSRDDFTREVTDASKEGETAVVVLLYKSGIPESRLLEELMPRVADKHKSTKFMKIVADQCIEGYPDRNVPTLLVYQGGEVRANIIGLTSLGGFKANPDTVEWVLAKHGALSTDMEEDPRKKLEASSGLGGRGGAGGYGRRRGDSEDEDD